MVDALQYRCLPRVSYIWCVRIYVYDSNLSISVFVCMSMFLYLLLCLYIYINSSQGGVDSLFI